MTPARFLPQRFLPPRFLPQRFLQLALLLLPAAATGATRERSVGSFDRLRVAGPFEVRIETGRPASARMEADDASVDRIEVTVEGDTLVVRMGNGGWGETPAGRAAAPPVVTLSTPALRSIAVSAGAHVVAGDR
ncbi:GIN domain-containing protein, partial [Sphingomonas bacterium]|uniref:GIN domain-containing protein n=1 Tax=Sphingomonas bacterium TaxID=1895847 RepID=UPI001C2CE336